MLKNALVDNPPMLIRDGGVIAEGFDEEQPYAQTGFDFIASLGTLDTLNDLPGALIHIRQALAPGQTSVTLSVAGLAPGVYTVRVGAVARRLVVQ